MPKPTNTALNVNDNFSDREVNPQHGDADSQDEVTLKSDIPSAGAAPPSRLADVGAADYTEEAASGNTAPIPASINADGDFDQDQYSVPEGGTFMLKLSVGFKGKILLSVQKSQFQGKKSQFQGKNAIINVGV